MTDRAPESITDRSLDGFLGSCTKQGLESLICGSLNMLDDHCTFTFFLPTSCDGKQNNVVMLHFTKTNRAHAQVSFMHSH